MSNLIPPLPNTPVMWVPDGELHADIAAGGWPEVSSVELRHTVTGGFPRQGTTVRVARDSGHLRVLFAAVDAEPWATLTQRDAPLYTEEVFEVFLDTQGDLGAYVEVEVNPLGAVMDLLVRRNRRGLLKDFRWSCAGLSAFARRTSEGWAAELALPWEGLAVDPPSAGTEWRANFLRIDRPSGAPRELSAWSATGVEQFHVPERFGYLLFV